MGQLRLGVIGATRKENERRLPIYPHHLNRIDADFATFATAIRKSVRSLNVKPSRAVGQRIFSGIEFSACRTCPASLPAASSPSFEWALMVSVTSWRRIS